MRSALTRHLAEQQQQRHPEEKDNLTCFMNHKMPSNSVRVSLVTHKALQWATGMAALGAGIRVETTGCWPNATSGTPPTSSHPFKCA